MEHPTNHSAADKHLDRRWLKRQIGVWRSLALVALTVLATVLALRYIDGGPNDGFSTGPHIARLSIDGVIGTDSELLSRIDKLSKNSDVVAVILRLNSPGGTYAGSEALYSALRALAEAKPTVAVIDGVAASGAYMAAIATDRIFARAGSITGSIGVIMQMPNIKGLMDHIGVGYEAIRSAPLKATPTPFEDTSAASRAAAQDIVQDLFDQFVERVKERRTLTATALNVSTSGRVFTGKQALPLGLIDALGGETEATGWLEQHAEIAAGTRVLDAKSKDEAIQFRDLIERIGGTRFFGTQPMLDGPLAVWQSTM
jgi:protease IV